ncbi:hypothetical protein D3C87_405770 [compost metagenome]
MSTDSNKEKGMIDERELMHMMAGDRPANPRPASVAGREAEAAPKSSAPAQGRGDYLELFFSEAASNARSGKSVYIRPEFHERLTRIVQVIGEDKISIYAYLDNVLALHFREFGQQIIESFNDKYKPIL